MKSHSAREKMNNLYFFRLKAELALLPRVVFADLAPTGVLHGTPSGKESVYLLA